MAKLYTDDDLARAERALDYEGYEVSVNTLHMIAIVLDAVLPAYRKRILNELADFVDKWGIKGVTGNAYVSNFLRHMGEEECPDCGMRGLHAADHDMPWPEETP